MTGVNQTPVRKPIWDGKDVDPRDIAEFIRDVRARLEQLGLFQIKEVTGLYTEPMALDVDHNPEIIFAARIRNNDKQETPVLSGGLAHWQWAGSYAQINSIDGMSPGDGVTYIFTFWVIG